MKKSNSFQVTPEQIVDKDGVSLQEPKLEQNTLARGDVMILGWKTPKAPSINSQVTPNFISEFESVAPSKYTFCWKSWYRTEMAMLSPLGNMAKGS